MVGAERLLDGIVEHVTDVTDCVVCGIETASYSKEGEDEPSELRMSCGSALKHLDYTGPLTWTCKFADGKFGDDREIANYVLVSRMWLKVESGEVDHWGPH